MSLNEPGGTARFIFGSSASYLAVMVAERAISLLLMPLMTRLFTPSEYSVILLMNNFAGFINPLFGLGLAFPTLFTGAASDAERRDMCTTILLSVAAILSLLFAAIAALSHQISVYFLHTPQYRNVIALGALWACVNAFSLSFVLIVRLTEWHKLYFMVQIPALVLQTGLIVWLVAFAAMGLTGYYVAVTAAAVLTALTYIVVLRRWLSGRLDRRWIVGGGRIGLQAMPWLLAVLLTTSSAAFFLTRAGHLEDAGLFTVAMGASAILLSLSNSFENVWTPFVLARRDRADLARIQIRFFSLYSSIMLLMASALGLFAHEIFWILAGPAFREGYRFVPALSIAYCLYSFANSFAQGLQARERTVHYAWIGVAASAAFLAICLPSVGRVGAWGIIAAMAGGFLTMLVLLQWTSGRLLPVGYPWLRHGLMWLVAIAVIACAFALDIGWVAVAVKSAALAGIASLPFLFGALRWADLLSAKQLLFAPKVA